MAHTPTDIREFWFSARVRSDWFNRNPELDKEIRNQFTPTYEAAREGKLRNWAATPEGILGLVIVLDQFPRNMFRDSPRAFESDAMAIALSKFAITQKFDRKLNKEQLQFLYMPFQHSEVLNDQALGVELFIDLDNKGALEYALQHMKIIDQFGRFPHRNKVLGRANTAEETEFLKTNKGFW